MSHSTKSFITDTSTFEVPSYGNTSSAKSRPIAGGGIYAPGSSLGSCGGFEYFMRRGKLDLSEDGLFTALHVSEAFDSDVLEHPV